MELLDARSAISVFDARLRRIVATDRGGGFLANGGRARARRQLLPDVPECDFAQRYVVIRAENLDGLVECVVIARHQPLEGHGDRAETVGHGRRTPPAPLFRTEIERQSLDHHRQVGPQRAAVLKLTEDGVVVFDESEVDVAGKVLPLRRREVPPSTSRPYDLANQIEMVDEQPLIIHVVLFGELAALFVRVTANTSTLPRFDNFVCS